MNVSPSDSCSIEMLHWLRYLLGYPCLCNKGPQNLLLNTSTSLGENWIGQCPLLNHDWTGSHLSCFNMTVTGMRPVSKLWGRTGPNGSTCPNIQTHVTPYHTMGHPFYVSPCLTVDHMPKETALFGPSRTPAGPQACGCRRRGDGHRGAVPRENRGMSSRCFRNQRTSQTKRLPFPW